MGVALLHAVARAGRRRITRVLLIGVLTGAAVRPLAVTDNASAASALAVTTGGVHMALTFNSLEPTVGGVKQQEVGAVDYVWGADQQAPGDINTPGGSAWHDFYIPWSQEEVNSYSPSWFKTNHPDWLLYRSDRTTLATYGSYTYAPLDYTNPAVQQFILTNYAFPALQNGFNGIAWDNAPSYNGGLAAGHYSADGTWVPLYNGNDVDTAWSNAQATAMSQMASAIKSRFPLARISTNDGFFPDQTNVSSEFYDPPLASVDTVVDEGAFYDTAPVTTQPVNQWYSKNPFLDKANKLVSLQRDQGKASVLIYALPYSVTPYMTDSNSRARADLQWCLATYLLVKYSHTYFFWAGNQQYGYGPAQLVQHEYAKAQAIGSPTDDFYASQSVYMRDFTNGLSVVNPSATATVNVSLPQGKYVDLYGNPVATQAMGPHSGMVLLLAPASSTPTPTNTPVPTSTPAPTSTPTPTNTPVPTNTATPTNTPVPTNTAVPTSTSIATNTPVPSATATNTPIPTKTPTPRPTATNTPAPTGTTVPTGTSVPTSTATPTSTAVPTNTATPTNTAVPTDTPTSTSTPVPTDTPTDTPVPTDTVTPSPTPTSTPVLAATYQVSGQPATFSAGTTANVSVTLTNSGNTTWQEGGTTPVHLGVHFALHGGGYGTSGIDSTWLSNQRITLPHNVHPGHTITMNVPVTAPTVPGTYTVEYQMVQEGVQWFSQFADVAAQIPSITSASTTAVYSITGQPAAAGAGTTVPVSVNITNQGKTLWPAGGDAPVHLGVHLALRGGGYGASGLDSTWLTNQRIALPSDVAPGQSVTLQVPAAMPAVQGSYTLEYELVQEDVAWFPQFLDTQIQVGDPDRTATYSISAPGGLSAGIPSSINVTVTNTGAATWPAGGSTPVHLGIHFASRGGGYGLSGVDHSWLTNQRVELPSDVAPGQSVTLQVPLSTPSTPGNYTLEAQMVQEYVAWFGQYADTPVHVASSALAASYSVSAPSSLSQAASNTVSVTVTNLGTNTWTAGGSTPVHLGVHFASQGGGYGVSGFDSTWLTNDRISLPNDVAPGESVTLQVPLTLPANTGAYTLEFQMVQEMVAWFPQYSDLSEQVTS